MPDPGSFTSDSDRPGKRPPGGGWKAGDRVLAPWEPTFLYAGRIVQLTGERARIEFDDGDAGWVEVAHLQPLSLSLGTRVMSRRRMGPHFFPGEIHEVDGEKVHVEFDDGKEEWTTVASLRIPCPPRGRGAEQLKATSHLAFQGRLQEGDRVWAVWKESALFAGTVTQRLGREVHVQFDDGDEAWVMVEEVMPLDIIVGMFVMGRWRMGPQFYPGRITDTEGERIHVRYEDGDEEWTTAEALALPIQRPQPSAEAPTTPETAVPANVQVQVGWNPQVVCWVGGIVLVMVAALFYWLGQR